MLDERRFDLLACPACRAALGREDSWVVCAGCDTKYPISGGQLDLDLREPITLDLATTVKPFGHADSRYQRRPRPIPLNPDGHIDIDPYAYEDRLWFGNGLTRELASWMPAGTSDDTLLDLGCGQRRCKPVLDMTGMYYLGLDVAGDAPDLLGTGEALPLADDSIDFVFSLAVLPHTQHPGLVCREIRRVLKPGALFIGTSQFLEACHLQSRHHASTLGLLDWFEEGELEILHLEANTGWSGPGACARMGYYPSTFGVARAAAAVMDAAHRASLYVRPRKANPPLGEALPERYTGGFRFVVRKPA